MTPKHLVTSIWKNNGFKKNCSIKKLLLVQSLNFLKVIFKNTIYIFLHKIFYFYMEDSDFKNKK